MNEEAMVSRSAFAKVQNENYRLKRILRVLCLGEPWEAIKLRIEYRELLAKEAAEWDIIKKLFTESREAAIRSHRQKETIPTRPVFPPDRIEIHSDPGKLRPTASPTPDLCCGMYPLPDNKPDVVECTHEHWGCPYHACLSDDCQKEVVKELGHDLGAGMCEGKPEQS